MSLVAVIGSVAAVIAVVFMWIQLQGEIANRKEVDRLVLAREPRVEPLTPIIREGTGSFWVIVPIQNVSGSSSAIAHRIQASFTFSNDNLIKEVDASSFTVIGGGKGDYSVTLELNVLYPRSVIYATFLVEKKEIPEILISWAEETAWQTIPLQD